MTSLPDISEVQYLDLLKDINNFSIIDTRTTSFEDIFQALMPIIRHFVHFVNNYTGTVYRVRKGDFDCNELKESDFWYPPKELARIGRANKENFPILYTSNNILCALAECHVESGDRFILIEYKIKSPLRYIDPSKNLSNTPFNMTKLQKKYYKTINSFIFSEVMIPDFGNFGDSYKKSINIFESLLNGPSSNCYMYPSVEGFLKGTNFAIFADVAQKILAITDVNYLKLVDKAGLQEMEKIQGLFKPS